MQILFYLYDNALILKSSLILSNTKTIIWSKKGVWVLVAKIFFLQSRQMKLFDSTGAWYKIVQTNIVLFNFALILLL